MRDTQKNSGLSRRQAVGRIGAALLAGQSHAAETDLRVAGQDVEVRISPVSQYTVRLSVLPIQDGKAAAVTGDGTLVRESWGPPAAAWRGPAAARTVKLGSLTVEFTPDPLAFTISKMVGKAAVRVDKETGAVSFATGGAPIFGMGEGGPQFDRRGNTDRMFNGSSGYNLRTFGSRVPVPWLIGAAGWAMYFHQPFGRFDLTGDEGKFLPATGAALPLDIFVVVSAEPATVMAEYALLTGLAELPALWTLGYQQSHRTLGSREEILNEAKTFREKKLPCDTLIYLGTGFCPSGWNTSNGEFGFNQKVMPDPKALFDQLHEDHFKVVLHVAYPTGIREMAGTVKDVCDAQRRAETQPACYWEMHRPVLRTGVDGWWPDEGDALNLPSRLVRNRMYWEASQIDHPDRRPFALHRNGAAGMQRYGAFLWSGDVSSLWETLKNQVPIGITCGLTGIPYWGTDIGGFVPTAELTGELYVRWFQFGAFCTLFRSHGRVWTLRLPWGWNQGVPTPPVSNETPLRAPETEYRNAAVEPICRKYLELRYRLMPYLYSAVRECTRTGMPPMRGLWLHYAGDPAAVARGDEYLWGRDLLVAPVVEKGATARRVYLPRGVWHDFWTGERLAGGTEISRPVDLETLPIYVRAGAIVPMGPVKQYTGEAVEAPLEISVYPGADGSFLLYEDDGASFGYRNGEWMGIQMAWNDARQTLGLRLAAGSKMLPPTRRSIVVKAGAASKRAVFDGRPMEVQLR
jgi:alpha-glucosidase/alpha-D-xyloside xylohydrolase